MAYYIQITDVLWLCEPQNIKDRFGLIYLWLRGKTRKITIEQKGMKRKVWVFMVKDSEVLKKTLTPI